MYNGGIWATRTTELTEEKLFMDGKILVEELLAYAKVHLSLDPLDTPWLRNRLLAALRLDGATAAEADTAHVAALDVPDTLTEKLRTYARERDLCEEGYEAIFATEVMGLMTPPPSAINALFEKKKQTEGLDAAIAWFYSLCIHNDYIQKTAISRNREWEYRDGDNTLEITINLSKPEKSNKEIAKLLTAPKQTEKYPACALCQENEGYEGTLTHPARGNLRTLSLTMGGEDWFMQYSPYAYYREHCIAISRAHTPMKVDATTPAKLLDFVDAFPQYFIGSNAALPIVGGSILNHEHYQGGGTLLPMQKAPVEKTYVLPAYPTVKLGRLSWYNSALRLESSDRAALLAVAVRVIEAWRDFSAPEIGIHAKSGDVPHNTLSPIARRVGDVYIMDMILRNNRTSEEYPDGIYHAHPEYHNIKKEGIGLIEAMGRFILPGRLKTQLADVAAILSGETPYDAAALRAEDHPLAVHADMIASLVAEHGTALAPAEAERAVRDRVNRVCAAILDNTAVFKRDERGLAAFDRFISLVENA